jgi:hypothetical protein
MAVPYGSGAGGFLSPRGVDFAVIGEAWEIFKRDIGAWLTFALLWHIPYVALIGGMIAAIFPFVMANPDMSNFAVLALVPVMFPFLFGMYIVTTFFYAASGLLTARALCGEPVNVGDGWGVFKFTGPLIVVGLVQGLIILILGYCCQFLVPLAFIFVAAAPFLVVFEKLSVMDAIAKSIALAKPFWLMGALLSFVGYLIYSLGYMFCLVGGLVTMPLFGIILALMYRDLGGSGLTPSFGGGGGATNYPREGGGYMPGYGGPVDPPAGS